MQARRQGDVIIKSIKAVPKDLETDPSKVLAYGEHSGHSHQITSGEANVLVNKALGLMFLQVLSENAVLSHEEHQDINLPMGNYEVLIQREYDFMEGTRKVLD